MSNENTPIIRKIRTSEDENAGAQYNIGTSAEYVDYNDSTVAQAIENLEEEVGRLNQEVDNQTAQITEMDQTFGTAKKVINKINKFQNVVDGLPQDIEHQVQKNINNTKFYTKDILWQPEFHRPLRSVLGNLINLPLQATSLRDWIEKISAMSGSSPGGGGGGSEPPPTIMGGNHLNAIDIQSLKISDLKNTSTIQVIVQRATVTCSSNTDNCEFAVYCEGAGYAKGGEVIATGGEGTTVEITLQSGLYKVWVEATNSENVRATQYFIIWADDLVDDDPEIL